MQTLRTVMLIVVLLQQISFCVVDKKTGIRRIAMWIASVVEALGEHGVHGAMQANHCGLTIFGWLLGEAKLRRKKKDSRGEEPPRHSGLAPKSETSD
jgi:hypothetical protein